MTRVAVDLNVRTRGGTYSGVEDADGPLTVGQAVTAYEAETGVEGPATVTSIDHAQRLVYLAVDWAALTPEETP